MYVRIISTVKLLFVKIFVGLPKFDNHAKRTLSKVLEYNKY